MTTMINGNDDTCQRWQMTTINDKYDKWQMINDNNDKWQRW